MNVYQRGESGDETGDDAHTSERAVERRRMPWFTIGRRGMIVRTRRRDRVDR